MCVSPRRRDVAVGFARPRGGFMVAAIFSAYRKPAARRHPRGRNLFALFVRGHVRRAESRRRIRANCDGHVSPRRFATRTPFGGNVGSRKSLCNRALDPWPRRSIDRERDRVLSIGKYLITLHLQLSDFKTYFCIVPCSGGFEFKNS